MCSVFIVAVGSTLAPFPVSIKSHSHKILDFKIWEHNFKFIHQTLYSFKKSISTLLLEISHYPITECTLGLLIVLLTCVSPVLACPISSHYCILFLSGATINSFSCSFLFSRASAHTHIFIVSSSTPNSLSGYFSKQRQSVLPKKNPGITCY